MKDPDLWARLTAHDFAMTEPGHDLAAMVARETTLTAAQAHIAVEEYRRFLYLAAAHGPAIAPSHVVHAVWRVHLDDRHAYGIMLENVISGTLPRFNASRVPKAYGPVDASTLALLRSEFGGAPNPKVWPDANLRRWAIGIGWAVAAGFVVAVIGIIRMDNIMIAAGTVIAVIAFAWSITYPPWSVGKRQDGSGEGGTMMTDSGGRGDSGKTDHDSSADGAGGGDGGGGGGD